MENIINIKIIENNKGCHEDLLFGIPQLNIQHAFDTYYFAIAIEPRRGIAEIKKAVGELLTSWNIRVNEMKTGEVVYLPIDFSDQHTGCFKVEKQNGLNLIYGYSRRGGWSVDLLNLADYYDSITDFEAENSKPIYVTENDFKLCLHRIIDELNAG